MFDSMESFIYAYLKNPSAAIAEARLASNASDLSDNIDDEVIYSQLASPEFRLYEEIILSSEMEEAPRANLFQVVA